MTARDSILWPRLGSARSLLASVLATMLIAAAAGGAATGLLPGP